MGIRLEGNGWGIPKYQVSGFKFKVPKTIPKHCIFGGQIIAVGFLTVWVVCVKAERFSYIAFSAKSHIERRVRFFKVQFFHLKGVEMLSVLLRTPIAIQVNINIMRAFFQMQKALLTLSEAYRQMENIRSDIGRLRIEMYEAMRCQNDINEMFSKEQDSISVQLENLNDAMAQLQAEANQKQLNASQNPIGFVLRNNK